METKTEKPKSLDHKICELATMQHGVVTRAQLVELTASDEQIGRRVATYRLVVIAKGVYALGHGALGRRGRTNAIILLAGRDNGAISYISAARSWDMVPQAREGDIHVSVRDRRKLVVPPGIKLHRPRNLTKDESVERFGYLTTTPERTLQDLLAESKTPEITRMLERMVTIVGRSPDALHKWAKTVPPVHGRPRLYDALDDIVGPAILRSELETQFRTLCQLAGIPLPLTNTRLGRWEVDALWPELRLVVELDSYKFHGGRWQFHRDRDKGLDLADLGYEVLRLTWRQVKHDQAAVGARLGRILARRALEVGTTRSAVAVG